MISFILKKTELALLYTYVFFVCTERLYIQWPILPSNIIAGFLILFLMFRMTNRIRKINILKSMVLFVGWCIVSFLWTQNLNVALNRCLMIVFLVILSYLIINRGVSKKELIIIELVMIASGITNSMELILNGQNFFGSIVASRISLDSNNDPNYFAMSLIVPFFAGYDLCWKEKIIYKITGTVGMLIIGYGVLLLVSRGALLGIVVGVAISLFIRRKFKILACFIFMIGTILSIVSQELERFSLDHIIERGGAGRTGIWMVAYEMIKDNFINGVGLNNFQNRYNEYAAISSTGFIEGTYRVPHNGYLEILAELGIIGFVMYFNIFYSALKKYFKYIKVENIGLFCGLIAIMIAGGFLTVVAERPVWLIFALLIGSTKNEKTRCS